MSGYTSLACSWEGFLDHASLLTGHLYALKKLSMYYPIAFHQNTYNESTKKGALFEPLNSRNHFRVGWWDVDFRFFPSVTFYLGMILLNNLKIPSQVSFKLLWIMASMVGIHNHCFKHVADIFSGKSPLLIPNSNWSPLSKVSPPVVVPPNFKLRTVIWVQVFQDWNMWNSKSAN